VIDVTPSDFIRTHKGLVRLLRTIEQHEADDPELSTRLLCEQVFHSRNYCYELLEQARERGYVTRTEVPAIGKGNRRIVNRLTPAGKQLLRELEEEEEK
jgi:hypothetical protein